VRPANTGATTALPRYADPGPPCPACGAASPEGADYCVRCGRRLADPAPVPPPPAPIAVNRPPQAPPVVRHRRRRRRLEHAGGPVFLIGLGLLFLLKAPFFPAILVVIGLSMFVSAAARGKVAEGLQHTIWLFGLAVLFTIPRLWVPGIFVLIGLHALFGQMCKTARRP
jgi:hypothetical protein